MKFQEFKKKHFLMKWRVYNITFIYRFYKDDYRISSHFQVYYIISILICYIILNDI